MEPPTTTTTTTTLPGSTASRRDLLQIPRAPSWLNDYSQGREEVGGESCQQRPQQIIIIIIRSSNISHQGPGRQEEEEVVVVEVDVEEEVWAIACKATT
ncbi:unnamed protein product [Ranitomeya imitator]|uniref:Uncharacterized protein n=1 Tax=Ranitomeya imitator TaxID=111125 RepID=A0ABN9M2V8_9NEOB|nr:unnamed protein product [Ranitomeya imitator]